MDESTRVIEEFLRSFKREREYYEKQANKAKEICEEELQRSAIQAQVTSRAKDHHSLREKLNQRSKKRGGYDSIQTIRDDIVDLAGVRISLYFPDHLLATEKIIGTHFRIREPVDHGADKRGSEDTDQNDYVERFSGYRGKHFRVFLKSEHNDSKDDEYNDGPEDIIEIQVVSMLHHTWAQVGHDIVYKQMSGSVSVEERRILDGLSGLIQVGELLLEQLHATYLTRSKSQDKRFTNVYELGSFLAAQDLPSETDNGSLEMVQDFLKSIGYHKPSLLESVISGLHESGWQEGGIVKHLSLLGRAKPTLSVFLMDAVLTRLDKKRQVSRKVNDIKPPSSLPQLKATVRTFIVLDALFPPFEPWANQLVKEGETGSTQPKFSEWLDVVKNMDGVIQGQRKPTDEEELELERHSLWKFLQHHHDPVISFAFRVANLGTIKDLSRFTQLRRILRFAVPINGAHLPLRRVSARRPRTGSNIV